MVTQRFWTPNDFLQNSLRITDTCFRVMGYARSGQHAISNWLHSHFETGLWYNNICGELRPDGTGVDYTLYRYASDVGKPIASKQDYLDAESQRHWHAVGLGFEGCQSRYQHLFDALDINHVPLLLVVRDIRNQTASITKHPDIEVDDKFLTEWEANALLALDPDPNVVVVKYNQWTSSREYRVSLFDSIQERCGFKRNYDDAHSQKMINIGGGSSFTGMRLADQAHTMNTRKRYQAPEMRSVIDALPDKLLRLDRQLFGEIP